FLERCAYPALGRARASCARRGPPRASRQTPDFQRGCGADAAAHAPTFGERFLISDDTEKSLARRNELGNRRRRAPSRTAGGARHVPVLGRPSPPWKPACLVVLVVGVAPVRAEPPPPTTAMARPPAPTPSPSELVALGRQLFFDRGLSDPAGTSCASCHDPAQ